jgi:cytochrome c biogenesis protein CcmG/thiol:disulfide interchange protein DsbE
MKRAAARTMRYAKVFAVCMPVALLLVCHSACLTAQTVASSSLVNRRAPDFQRQSLRHRTISLKDYRGNVVLLDFWATWCAPCLTELPRFVAWQRQYGPRGLQVIAISMDDDAQPARLAAQKYALNFPVIMGDAKLGELYGGILGLPVTFIIDAKGTVRFEHQGIVKPDALQNEIQELLPSR